MQNPYETKGSPLDFLALWDVLFRKLFNVAKGSPFIFFVTKWMLKNIKGSPISHFCHQDTFKILVFRLKTETFIRLFEKFLNVSKGSRFVFFSVFCNKLNVEKAQMVPLFSLFGTMRLFQNSYFGLKLVSISIHSFFFSKVFEFLMLYMNYIAFY